MSAVLVAAGVSKQFFGNRAVDDVSLTVHAGECVALVGPNGAGKTTMLNVLTGQHRPDAGTVRLLDADVTQREPSHPVRRPLVRTYQDGGTFTRLTAVENVAVALLARGTRPAEARRRSVAAVERMGLGPVANVRGDRLSGGQRKLVDFARFVAVDARVVLLDEPTAGVNPAISESLGALIAERRDAGVAFVIVSHELPWVFQLASRAICMATGAILAEGAPDAVASDPAVHEAYLA